MGVTLAKSPGDRSRNTSGSQYQDRDTLHRTFAGSIDFKQGFDAIHRSAVIGVVTDDVVVIEDQRINRTDAIGARFGLRATRQRIFLMRDRHAQSTDV